MHDKIKLHILNFLNKYGRTINTDIFAPPPKHPKVTNIDKRSTHLDCSI